MFTRNLYVPCSSLEIVVVVYTNNIVVAFMDGQKVLLIDLLIPIRSFECIGRHNRPIQTSRIILAERISRFRNQTLKWTDTIGRYKKQTLKWTNTIAQHKNRTLKWTNTIARYKNRNLKATDGPQIENQIFWIRILL